MRLSGTEKVGVLELISHLVALLPLAPVRPNYRSTAVGYKDCPDRHIEHGNEHGDYSDEKNLHEGLLHWQKDAVNRRGFLQVDRWTGWGRTGRIGIATFFRKPRKRYRSKDQSLKDVGSRRYSTLIECVASSSISNPIKDPSRPRPRCLAFRLQSASLCSTGYPSASQNERADRNSAFVIASRIVLPPRSLHLPMISAIDGFWRL